MFWKQYIITLSVLLPVRRNFSLIARCFLQVHSLFVTRFKITPDSLQKSFAVKNHSLLVAEVVRCRKLSLLVAKSAGCKISLVNRWETRRLLVAEAARGKNSLVCRCRIQSLLVAKFARYSLQICHSLFFEKFACYSLQR